MKRTINITWVRTEEDGGCNACSARPEHVLLIRFLSSSVRLCPECTKLLRRDLALLPSLGLL